jgi:pilus assembly protein CpaC
MERPDFSVQIGETFRLRHDQLGAIQEAIASRAGVVSFESDPRDPTLILVRGTSVGVTQVTIRAKDKNGNDLPPSMKTIQVNPDISYIRSKVAETFPTANVKIVAGGPPGSLIVTGYVYSAEDIDALQTFINGIVSQFRAGPGAVTYNLRVSGPQVVQLDVCLASVNREKIRLLGVDFFHGDARSFLGTSIGGAGSTGATATAGPGGAIGQGSAASAGANFVFSTTEGAATFQGFIQALRDERMGKLLANPTLVTLSGRPARFLSGSEEPYGTAGSGGQSGGAGTGVQFRPVGTTLGFLPVVIGDGKIRLTVVAEASQKTGEVNQPNIVAPIISAQNVGTTVELENGQSIAIGGLIQNTVSGEVKKYPFIGDLPFIGTFFRSVSFDEKEEETIMLVRVTLVEAMDSAQRSRIRLPGSETRSVTDFELYIEGILEAPRGPRDPFPNRVYVPAFKNDAPFGVRSGECSTPGPICGPGKHGWSHGGNGNCATCGTPAQANATQPMNVPNPMGLQQAQQVTPESTPAQVSVPMNPPAEPIKNSGEPTPVPVVPPTEATAVPVVPATEPPVVPVVPVPTPEAGKSGTDLPVPPARPSGDPK